MMMKILVDFSERNYLDDWDSDVVMTKKPLLMVKSTSIVCQFSWLAWKVFSPGLAWLESFLVYSVTLAAEQLAHNMVCPYVQYIKVAYGVFGGGMWNYHFFKTSTIGLYQIAINALPAVQGR